MACANAGLEVILTDATGEALAAGEAAIRRNYDATVARGRLTPDGGRRAAGPHPPHAARGLRRARRRGGSGDRSGVRGSRAQAARVPRDRCAWRSPECILATNTSTLDIDAIAGATSRPEAVVGLHFFSPAAVMRLLEIVRGPRTDPGVLVSALAFAKRVRKLGVVVGNGPGFVGNRLMFPYMYETQFLVEEGATPAQVDRALTGFGMAMGMFAVDDMAGLDVGCARAARRSATSATRASAGRWSTIGWSRWAGSDRSAARAGIATTSRARRRRIPRSRRSSGRWRPTPASRQRTDRRRGDRRARDPRAGQRGRAGARGRRRRPRLGHRRDLRERLRVPGLARRPAVLRRSPSASATVLDRIRAFHREHGERWRPAPLLVELAERGGTFRDVGSREEPLTCRPPSRDACARRGCCRRTRSSAGTIAAGCASARRTPSGRIRRP